MSMYGFFKSSLILVAIFYVGAAFADTAEIACVASYRPSSVQLVGRIAQKMFYGEPGFGENPAGDRKENILLIRLDNPLDINADVTSDAESFSHVELVQLNGTTEIMRSLKSMGKARVALTGVLDMATTGHDHTDVVLSVVKIEPARPTQITKCLPIVSR